jgi:hypothetical protein
MSGRYLPIHEVSELCRVGTVVSLVPLGQPGTGEVVASSWSEALGDVVRIRPHDARTVAATLIVYGEDLHRLLASRPAA